MHAHRHTQAVAADTATARQRDAVNILLHFILLNDCCARVSIVLREVCVVMSARLTEAHDRADVTTDRMLHIAGDVLMLENHHTCTECLTFSLV